MSVSIPKVLHAITELSSSRIQLIISTYYNQLELARSTARCCKSKQASVKALYLKT
jgi:hypothetical protein